MTMAVIFQSFRRSALEWRRRKLYTITIGFLVSLILVSIEIYYLEKIYSSMGRGSDLIILAPVLELPHRFSNSILDGVIGICIMLVFYLVLFSPIIISFLDFWIMNIIVFISLSVIDIYIYKDSSELLSVIPRQKPPLSTYCALLLHFICVVLFIITILFMIAYCFIAYVQERARSSQRHPHS